MRAVCRFSCLSLYLCLLLSAAVPARAIFCRIGDRCDLCEVQFKEGQDCSSADLKGKEILKCNVKTNYIEPEEHAFLTCDGDLKTLRVEQCATINGLPMLFMYGRCMDPNVQRFKRQLNAAIIGSSRVGESCVFNTDCLQPDMYCSAGLCDCTSTAVARNDYCYKKINPGQSGCQYNEQCTTVWPGTTCSITGGIGTCLCSNQAGTSTTQNSVFTPATTRDGTVCVQTKDSTGAAVTAACPLPEYDMTAADISKLLGMDNNVPMTCDPTAANTGTTAGTDCVAATAKAGINQGDIMDCVKTGTSGGAATGVCCPSRALTCVSPLKTGSGTTNAQQRFWYNSVTGTCQQFSWYYTAGAITWDNTNTNNFGSLEHCESYCKNTCPRGIPQFTTVNTAQRDNVQVTCDSTSDGCTTNYECTTIGSYEWCCPEAQFVCTYSGGRTYTTTPTAADAGWNPTGASPPTTVVNPSAAATRWYFNTGTGLCATFPFYGQGGNFNNFASKDDCTNYCSSQLCTYGNPLKLTNGNNQRCSSDSDCPTTYSCNTNNAGNIAVCCPRSQQVCSQNKQIGVCTQWTTRYFHNPLTRDCEQFDYSGCQGNDNNFETLLDCQTFCRSTTPEPQCIQGIAYKDSYGAFYRCSGVAGLGTTCPANYECYFDGYMWGCCPSKSYTCALSSSVGRQCGPIIGRWFYDATNQRCDTLQFKGCDGNSNNFPTRQLCENYCGVGGCPSGGTVYKESDTGATRICSTAVPCPSGFECDTVNVEGTGINYCCPTKATICSNPPDQSTSCGNTNIQRYYFNLVSRTCTTFNFQGCDTNGNNFATLSQCNNFCTSAACIAGEVVLLNPNNQQAVSCNQQLANSCPTGYTCRFDSLTSQSVCCGATDMGVCPTGEKAYIDALTMSVRECLPNIVGSCTGDSYQCRFNNQKNKYYCCASASGEVCPKGKAVYLEPITRNSRKCTLSNVFNTCPSSYACQSAVTNAFQGYCCTIDPICPNNAEYDKDTAGNALQCTIGSSVVTCRTGFSCQTYSSSTSGNGYCCAGGTTAVQGGCPPNKYVYMLNNQTVSCNPFSSPSGCPTVNGYTCQWSNVNNRYQCCGNAPINQQTTTPTQNDGCPNAQISFRDPGTNTPRTCTVNSNTCPIGYFCQYSPTNNRFQCCGVSGGCPSNQVAFIAVTGQPQTCAANTVGQCQSGFTCQLASTGLNTCCTTGRTTTCQATQVLFNNICINKVNPGLTCQVTTQCLGNSNCISGTCQCASGQSIVNNICQTSTCPTGQVRINGVCQCPAGFALVNGVCVAQTTPTPTPTPGTATCAIPGQQPYIEPGTTSVRFCTPNFPGNCPVNYNCQYSAGARQNICCGSPSPSKNVCPTGSTPITDNGSPRICTGNTFGCPPQSTCRYSNAQRQYYCCGTTAPTPTGDGCPVGQTAYRQAGAGAPLVCTPGAANACPAGYSCSFSSTRFTNICCGVGTGGRTTGSNGCPRGSALIYQPTNSPLICSPNAGAASCPGGYNCLQSAGGSYQCCSLAARREPKDNATKPAEDKEIETNHVSSWPCRSYEVMVIHMENGQPKPRCETSCPSHQVPRKGVCVTPSQTEFKVMDATVEVSETKEE